MEIIDSKRIESVIPKYAEFMSDSASDKFIEMFNRLLDLEAELNCKRDEVRELEKKVKEQKELVNRLKDLFDINYYTKNFEPINNKASFAAFTPTDVRRSRVE